ncbi:MAG: PEP-utilizing enzyme, mobile region [Desulfobacterales bacterium]|nr:PEP-utilizing enzyme, mobile region [Desulfobacterales bacterium]MBL7101164.1 PEP-utilizing enzyme, mobile region [Desulfobacteraceae bacterium]MBL7172534.1 PEP-utilizing enzyme, mobile region [Desulfobacteraceae bacterium]
MADEHAGRFPDPHEYQVPPELEGWEEMYPSHHLFSEDRADWEKQQFWYQDKIHAPEPMPPLDLLFQEAWQIALSQYTTRVFCIPPAQGIAQRMVGCYMYICAVAPPPDEIIGEKAALFEKRVFYVFEHYNELWDKWLTKFKALGEEMKGLEIPKEMPKYVPEDQVLPAPTGCYVSYDLIEAFDKLVHQMFKGWQYHFEMLNLTYLAYLMFGDVSRKLFPGISESAIGKMVAGAYVSMFRPEEELCQLSRLAVSLSGVADILKKETTAAGKIAELERTPEGKQWLEAFDKAKDPWFYVSCGSGWFHFEGSWINNLDIPYSYIKSYVERLGNGETIERSLDQVEKERDETVAKYRDLIQSDEDRETFDGAYNTVRTIYRYAEDHLFWVEHWFHTIWFSRIREFGKLLVDNGMTNEVDDIFMFNRYEIPEILTEIATGWALGVGIPMRGDYYKAKAKKRKEILKAASEWNPTPALGVPPEEVAEPFTIMLWGVTTDKVKEWLKGMGEVSTKDVSELKGFAASAGVAEGPARVLKRLNEIMDLQAGDIMVCPTTNPSWAPVFTKIKAAVTDIGGLTSHAAIVCREYGVPSVTGTGVATSVIKTGDIIRVDGDTGVVTIVKRAE